MITELGTRNFKSWQSTGKLQFAPLTGFFGANNSGKTSILQLLLLLRQTTESQSPWHVPLDFGNDESLINLVNFDAVIHRHNPTFSLDISVSWKLPQQMKIEGDLTNSLSFSTAIVKRDEDAVLHNFSYRFHQHDFRIDRANQGHEFDYGLEDTLPVQPLKCYGVRSPTGVLEPFLPLQKAFEDLFSRILYVGPRREDPRRYYRWAESHPEDIGRRGEKMISALLSGRVQNRAIDERIMKWLQELDLIYSYTINSISDTEQDYELLVKQYKDGPEIGLTDVGFGVSQVLPLIAQCYYADEGSILILENPEAHLHPKAQSELADVFVDVVKNRNIQIILESHSEHLLLRLMRRIAEYGIEAEGISADQTAFHFCEIKDGNSTVKKLEVDTYGRISNWPKDFFGDDMGDVAKKTKAEMKRRKEKKK